jgi:hypothetical protein
VDTLQSNPRAIIYLVRKLLTDYYAGVGKNDPVIISSPPTITKGRIKKSGDAYILHFSYATDHEDKRMLAIGRLLLARCYPAAVKRALGAFDAILEHCPDHHEAQRAKIECLCLLAAFAPDVRPSEDFLEEALNLALELRRSRLQDPRALFALISVLFCCRYVWNAGLLVPRAIDSSEGDGAPGCLWISTFFLLMGEAGKAASAALKVADDRFDDSVAWAVTGFHYYFNHDFAESERCLAIALRLDSQSWLPYVGLIFVFLATDRPAKAFDTFEAMNDAMTDEPKHLLSGLGVLTSYRANGTDAPMRLYFEQDIRDLTEQRLCQRDFLQLAFVTLETDHATTILFLRMAYHSGNPLMLLLPHWPIFDSLREYPDFGELLREIELAEFQKPAISVDFLI